MGRERSDGGEFVETVTPNAVIGVFDSVNGPSITSADVADRLDCSRETARRKLNALSEQGQLEHRTTAGRVLWWRPSASSEGASAGPLRRLVGALDDEDVDRVRRRTTEFRDSVATEFAAPRSRRSE